MIPLFKTRVSETIKSRIDSVIESGYLADGQAVKEFEAQLGQFLGNPSVLAVSDISGAITLALTAAGVVRGDEVILSPMCCTASSMPVLNVGAIPVWADVDPDTGMVNEDTIEECITPKTKAILYLHWSGDVAHCHEIYALGKERGIAVIEDASEAFGASYRGQRVGCGKTADMTVFSFHAVKHLTTGEGGAISFAHQHHYEEVMKLKRYGIDQKTFRLKNGDLNPECDITRPGYNFYMTNIEATFGIENMVKLEEALQKHQANGQYLDRALSDVLGIQRLKREPHVESVYWTYSCRVKSRTDLINYLGKNGYQAQRLHLRNDLYHCYSDFRKDLPGTAVFDAENVSFPCGWWMDQSDGEALVELLSKRWA